MSHTPGPWYAGKTAGDHQGTVISEATGKTVAVAYDKDDAPLLAAAHEMLAALEEALAWNGADISGFEDISPNEDMLAARNKVLRDAIAKAKGTA